MCENGRDIGVFVYLAQHGKQAVCLRFKIVLATDGKKVRSTLQKGDFLVVAKNADIFIGGERFQICQHVVFFAVKQRQRGARRGSITSEGAGLLDPVTPEVLAEGGAFRVDR